MKQSTMIWSTRLPTRALSVVVALSVADCAHGTPTQVAPGKAECADVRLRVEQRRRDLAAGRLLRVVAGGSASPAHCPAESDALAALAVEARRSLGAELTPDGPVSAFSSPADTSAGYARAVAAYLAGQWAEAGKIALAVGAGGGALAPEGFILVVRSAVRAGDEPRAARMWARAYQAGCSSGSPCTPQLPREDLFGLAATLGRFVPVFSSGYCSRGFETTVVNGTWLVTSAASGRDIREIPSRVLLEHIEPPEKAAFVCLSPNGRHRVAVVPEGQSVTFFASAAGESWRGPLPIDYTEPSSPNTFIADDGRVVGFDGVKLATVDPGYKTWRDVPWPKDYHPTSGRLGPAGTLFVALTRDDAVKTGPRHLISRYELQTGNHTVLLDAGGMEVGPVDDRGRLMVLGDGALWMDGMTGKPLGKTTSEYPIGSPSVEFAPTAGMTRESSLVWEARGNGDVEFLLQDLVTGRDERVTWVWHAPDGWSNHTTFVPGDIPRVVGALPLGASGTLGAIRSWTVSQKQTSDSVHVRRQIELHAPGREPLQLVVTADREGAMVMDRSGRFEFIGRISPAFRASASCGSKDAANPPAPSDRAWPLEVCAAALENPGLTEAWFNSVNDRSEAPPRGRP